MEAGAVPRVRQPRLVRSSNTARRALGLLAAGLAVVPFAVPGLLSSFRAHPVPLAESSDDATSACTFVTLLGEGPSPSTAYALLRCPAARDSSRVARAAGLNNVPGGKPKYRHPQMGKGKKKRVHWDEDKKYQAHMSKIEKKTLWLNKLKGKFVPVGHKPWDKHRFRKVIIQVPLAQQQAANTKILTQCTEELRRITGMHPKVVKARTNNARLGWRMGMPAGVKVHIMGGLMYDFLERLNMVILPRVRDFEGLFPTSFTKDGDFWMRLESQEPFRELDELVDDRELVHGFHVGILNSCMTQPDGLTLMKDFGFPFGKPREIPIGRRRMQKRAYWRKKKEKKKTR